MRYMVTYSHQKRNKDGKKLKAIETLFKYIEADNASDAKDKCYNLLKEEEETISRNNNKIFNIGQFQIDYKIISAIKKL